MNVRLLAKSVRVISASCLAPVRFLLQLNHRGRDEARILMHAPLETHRDGKCNRNCNCIRDYLRAPTPDWDDWDDWDDWGHWGKWRA